MPHYILTVLLVKIYVIGNGPVLGPSIAFLNINLFTNLVVIVYMFIVLSLIVSINLRLFTKGDFLPVNNCLEIEYHISLKILLDKEPNLMCYGVML